MRERAIILLDAVREVGITDECMLDYLIYNCLSGDGAREVMELIIEEYDIEDEVKEVLGEEDDEEEDWEVLGYYIHKDDVGTELNGTKVMVIIEEYNERLTCYSPIGQHGELDREYFDECVEITKEEYLNASSCYTPSDYL